MAEGKMADNIDGIEEARRAGIIAKSSMKLTRDNVEEFLRQNRVIHDPTPLYYIT